VLVRSQPLPETPPPLAVKARSKRRWLVALGVASALGLLIGGGLAFRTSPPRPAAARAEAVALLPSAPARGDEGASSTIASAADVAVDLELPADPSPQTAPSAARAGVTAASIAKGATPPARSAEATTASAATVPKPAAEPVREAPGPAIVAAPAVAPPPEPAPAAAAPVAKPFSPDGARVSASVVAAARTPRAGMASLLSHVSFDQCYRDALRALGRAEGGSGTAHLEIDEDGVVRGAEVRLPAPIGSAAACFASKLRGQRVSIPDTGAATADIAFVLAPN